MGGQNAGRMGRAVAGLSGHSAVMAWKKIVRAGHYYIRFIKEGRSRQRRSRIIGSFHLPDPKPSIPNECFAIFAAKPSELAILPPKYGRCFTSILQADGLEAAIALLFFDYDRA